MNEILKEWNQLDPQTATDALLHCCASRRWALGVTLLRPYQYHDALFQSADRVWAAMEEPDWMEAFRAHPRIGDRKPAHATAQSSAWSQQEQLSTTTAHQQILDALVEGNRRYEELFGFTYIVCATGKSAEEMLAILQRRMNSDRQTELRKAAEQQRQITQIRLRKWLQL